MRNTFILAVPWLALTGCSFSASLGTTDGPTTDTSSLDASIDATFDGAPLTWTDTSESDFARVGAQLSNAIATPWGTLEPRGYIPGYWLAHAGTPNVPGFVGTEDQIDWNALPRNVATAIVNSATFSLAGGAAPPWLDAPADQYVVWVEGEVQLAPGLNQFQLSCDDFAAVQMVKPGETAFSDVVKNHFGAAAATGDVTNPDATPRWVPIRWALRDGGGGSGIDLKTRVGNTGTFLAIATNDMRVDTTQVPHLLAVGFNDFGATELVGLRQWQAPLINLPNSNSAPSGLGITLGTTFSLMWFGQYRVEQPGMHTFVFDTDDGHRLTIDGAVVVADRLTGGAQASTTSVELAAGWHDIQIDWWQRNGQARAIATLQAPGDVTAGPLPPERLRSVVTGRNRIIALPKAGTTNTNGSGNASISMPMALPSDAKIVDADLRIAYDGRDGVARLFDPAGNQLDTIALNDNATTFYHYHGNATLDANGTWRIDVTGQGNKQLSNVYLTVTYRSFTAPAMATQSGYRSAAKIFERPVTMQKMTWTTQGAGTVLGNIRSCAAACTDSDAWTSVTSGAPLVGLTGTHIEYRFEMTSDGIQVPAVESVTFEAVGS
ncbi:MAG TPA: PA14 domain-containing protein [Kofleriaceae bacterium]|nr:PA14 domain-containing protein [Kofleriaceae bacterium]